MRNLIVIMMALFSCSAMSETFVAKCSDFVGKHTDHVSGNSKPFRMNDGTTYEFSYTSSEGGSLKYVIDGAGVIDPKKEDRWHNLEIVGHSSSYVSATSFEGTEQLQFSLYPKLASAQIIWVMQPTKMKQEPAILVLKASCEFQSE